MVSCTAWMHMPRVSFIYALLWSKSEKAWSCNSDTFSIRLNWNRVCLPTQKGATIENAVAWEATSFYGQSTGLNSVTSATGFQCYFSRRRQANHFLPLICGCTTEQCGGDECRTSRAASEVLQNTLDIKSLSKSIKIAH